MEYYDFIAYSECIVSKYNHAKTLKDLAFSPKDIEIFRQT